MCQREEIRSLKRSDDTSGIGKREPVTCINVVSGRCNDKDRKKKTWLLQSVWVGTIVDLETRDCRLRVLLIDGTSREETTGDRGESYG